MARENGPARWGAPAATQMTRRSEIRRNVGTAELASMMKVPQHTESHIRILHVVGARPNFVKAAPVSQAKQAKAYRV